MEAEWRVRTPLSLPGHDMEIIPDFEMGGGVSGVALYCWSCGTESAIKRCDFWDWPDVRVYKPHEAMLELRKAAWKHSKGLL